MKSIQVYKILKKITPRFFAKIFRNVVYLPEYDELSMKATNPYIEDSDVYVYDNSPIKVGIIYGRMQYHKYWIAACRHFSISYQIIYLERNDWLEQVQSSGCSVYVVWPDISTLETKQMFDERLRIMEQELKVDIYPSIKEIWLYENKRVQYYWLKSNHFPVINTHVFYNCKEAVNYLKNANYPVVLKSNLGASASGVYIVEDRRKAIKMVKKFIHFGFKLKRKSANKKQKGSVYIQDYLTDLKEWRMVRIGDSFFGHGKDMKGQFHSGSGSANWNMPPQKAFELLKEITEVGGFSSMDVDIFEDKNGDLFVNELQTVFGNSIAKEQMKIDGVAGRYILEDNNWVFEKGSFCENHLCNLRLQYILERKTCEK